MAGRDLLRAGEVGDACAAQRRHMGNGQANAHGIVIDHRADAIVLDRPVDQASGSSSAMHSSTRRAISSVTMPRIIGGAIISGVRGFYR